MPSSMAFSVTRSEPELVAPVKPTPREIKPLSDIDDQEGLRDFIPSISVYRGDPSMEGNDPVEVIRKALGAALVFYYPLAGRLVEGPNRKLMVDCTAEGVLFIEADADISLDQLGDSIMPPFPNWEELLYTVPGSDGILGCPLLLLQVTRLNCGGYIVAVRANHTICDAQGIIQFLGAVGEIARGAHAPSIKPVWERERFNARQPPHITRKHYEYDEMAETRSLPIDWADSNNLVHKSFFFGPNEIRSLKAQLPPHLSTSSSFEIMTACLWKCRTIALELHPDDVVRISYMVNVRSKRFLSMPPGYYGNAFVCPAESAKADDVCKNSFGYIVEIVKKVKHQVDEEYIRSVADFMVIKGRPMYNVDSTYMVSDIRRLGFEDLNFGWGNPIYNGPTTAFTISTFLVRYKNSKGEDGTVASLILPMAAMEKFQEELKKMTKEHASTLALYPCLSAKSI